MNSNGDATRQLIDRMNDKAGPGEGQTGAAPSGGGPASPRASASRNRGAWVVSDDARTALERCDLFRDLNRDQLMEVAALVEEVSVEPEHPLLDEGAPANHIFVVTRGSGIAQLKLDRGWVSLGLVGPGEVAGWSSLIGGQVYPASVKALTPMSVARIDTSGITLLMNLEPSIGYPVHRRLSLIFYRQYESALSALKVSA